MTVLQQHLAANMKLLRKQSELSQAQLAERAGTSTNYIAMIETGKKFPSPQMFEKISTALQVSSPELFSQRGITRQEIDNLKSAILTEIEKVVVEKLSFK